MDFEYSTQKENEKLKLSLVEDKESATLNATSSSTSLASANLGAATLPNINWQLGSMYFQEEERDRSKYFLSSVILHIVLAVAAATMEIPKLELPKTEPITVEIKEYKPKFVSRGEPVPATRAESAPALKTVKMNAPKMAAEPARAAANNVAKANAAPAVAVKAATLPEADEDLAPVQQKAVGKNLKAAAYSKPVAARSATIDDLKAENINVSAIKAAKIQHFDDAEVDDAVAKAPVQKLAKNQLKGAQSQLMKEVAASDGALDEKAAGVASAISADAANRARLAASSKAARDAALANMRATENARVGGAIAGGTAVGAATNAGNPNGRASSQAGLADGNGSANTTATSGRGVGNNGANQAGSALAGYPEGIRSLDQLRQYPGNPKPQYANEERLAGHQGKITLIAYVNKNGTLSNFKMLQSTGWQNLDRKTLMALKQWKFYPGQEGWVELPFSWDLRGGPQQMPTYLRRKSY